MNFFKKHEIFQPTQYGFQKNKFTTHTALDLITDPFSLLVLFICNSIIEKQNSVSVYYQENSYYFGSFGVSIASSFGVFIVNELPFYSISMKK